MTRIRQCGGFWPILLIVMFGMLACGSAERDEGGAIINSGNLDIATMQVGDCFQNLHPDITMLDDVPGVPCSSPHDNEVYHTFPIEDDAWPGDEVIEQRAFNNCIDAFESHVEAEWEDSELDFTWFSPTQRAWEAARLPRYHLPGLFGRRETQRVCQGQPPLDYSSFQQSFAQLPRPRAWLLFLVPRV